MRLSTLHEMFAYNDWARDKVLSAAAPLRDEQLDRRFEIGPGTLRDTLRHLWAADRVWLDRWIDASRAKFPDAEPTLPMAELRKRFLRVGEQRGAFLGGLREEDLDRDITYVNSRGETWTYPMGDMMLHVCTHGSHHRAQAIHILRRIGAETPKPGADYIFYRMALENADPPGLDLRTLRRLLQYGKWATYRVLAAAERLDDASLDRAFEMGVGSLRKTLLHVRDAEQWWLANWTHEQGPTFPAPDLTCSIAELRRLVQQTARARDALLDDMTDADLSRIVVGRPRPDIVRRFPIGVTMLQLWHHGTHHRAQALAMLRQLGAERPEIDFLCMVDDERQAA